MEKMLSRRMVLIPALESEKFKSKKKTLQILIKKMFKGREMSQAQILILVKRVVKEETERYEREKAEKVEGN